MALETPNRTIASAVLLLQNMFTPGEETIEFASSSGFASVGFIDPTERPFGAVLVLSNPVNNNEGQVVLGGDLDADVEDTIAYITPTHFQTGDPRVDDLEPNQVAILDLEGDDVYRLTVQVSGQQAILPPDPNEPVAP